MANCSGSTTVSPTSGCFSSNAQSINQVNCGCTPCTQPVIINQGDVSNQVLVPVLADVIQNCVCLSKYEPSYPDNLIITTSLTQAASTTQAIPSGTICITNVSYSYSCVGVPSDVVVSGTAPDFIATVTPPTISGNVGSNGVILSPTVPSCSCTGAFDTGGTPATVTATVPLYNNFSGNVTTASCCCNQEAQAYAQNKVVERNVAFAICNLSIGVSGTIGGVPFTGTVTGTTDAAGDITPLPTYVTIDTLGFPATLNFAGIMCLPTSTSLTISENLDNCFIVDCIRPNTATYVVADDPSGTGTYATFEASADLSLVISKNIYATTSQKLAVMTNSGSQVVCGDSTTIPACPQGTPCAATAPCPGPVPTPLA